jgi:hypothetical protein
MLISRELCAALSDAVITHEIHDPLVRIILIFRIPSETANEYISKYVLKFILKNMTHSDG